MTHFEYQYCPEPGLATDTVKNRLSIINLLLANKSMQISDFTTELNLSSTALHHHLNVLKKADLLTEHRENKKIFYSINPNGFKFMSEAMLNIAKGIKLQ